VEAALMHEDIWMDTMQLTGAFYYFYERAVPNPFKFQVSLVDTERSCSIHVRVIRGICASGAQLRQFSMVTHLANWSRLDI
jgi:hypothetical protein